MQSKILFNGGSMEEKICLIRHACENIPPWVPLFGMMAKGRNTEHAPIMTRVIEMLIAAGIPALVLLYGMTERLDERTDALKEQMELSLKPIIEKVSEVKQSQRVMQVDITELKIQVERIKK